MARERSPSIEEAADELYASSLETFIERRRTLADRLREAGDAASAKRVAGLPKPSLSAWAVNQLWWSDRAAFEALYAAAKSLRSAPHARQAFEGQMRALRDRARDLLAAAGHPATPTLLRRITTSLYALGAIGSFAPDANGRLVADREPPGFEAMEAGLRLATPAEDGSQREATATARTGARSARGATTARLDHKVRETGEAGHAAGEAPSQRRQTVETWRAANALKRELRSLETQTSRQAVVIARDERTLDAIAVDETKLETQRIELEAEAKKLEDQRTKLEAEAKKLEKQRTRLEEQRAELETRREQVESAIAGAREDMRRTTARAGEVERALRDLG
jgi:DNA repair exonuclease SbcCD ATPase subunit